MGQLSSETGCTCDAESNRQQIIALNQHWTFLKYQKVRWPPWGKDPERWPWEYEAVTLGLPYGLIALVLSMIYLFVFQFVYSGPSSNQFSPDNVSVEDATSPNHLDRLRGAWDGAYPFQAYATLMSFLMVFRTWTRWHSMLLCSGGMIVILHLPRRTNIAYQRYWEARTHLDDFLAKLTDVLSTTLTLSNANTAYHLKTREWMKKRSLVRAQRSGGCFVKNGVYCEKRGRRLKGEELEKEQRNRLDEELNSYRDFVLKKKRRFENILIHTISLLHGVALGVLRDDFDLSNIILHNAGVSKKQGNPAFRYAFNEEQLREGEHSDKMTAYSYKTQRARRIICNVLIFIPVTCSNTVGSDGMELTCRDCKVSPNKKKMNDCLRCKALNTKVLTKLDFFHKSHKLPVIGGISLAEATALGAQATDNRWCLPPWKTKSFHTESRRECNARIHCLQLPVSTAEEGLKTQYLPPGAERAAVVRVWLEQLLIERMWSQPAKTIPGDTSFMRSLIIGYIADAMKAYEHCLKLSNHQLPFGWYSASHTFLWVFILTLPFIAAVWIHVWWITLGTSFMIVWAYSTMHEIALQLEEPFRWYPNPIPLSHRQYTFNERLIAIKNSRRPLSAADYFRDVLDGDAHVKCRKFECESDFGEPRFRHDDIRSHFLDEQAAEAAPVEAFILYKNADFRKCKTSNCILNVVKKRRMKWNKGQAFCPTEAAQETCQCKSGCWQQQTSAVPQGHMDRIMAPSALFPDNDALKGGDQLYQSDCSSYEYTDEDWQQHAAVRASSSDRGCGHHVSQSQNVNIHRAISTTWTSNMAHPTEHDLEFEAKCEEERAQEDGAWLESPTSPDLRHVFVEGSNIIGCVDHQDDWHASYEAQKCHDNTGRSSQVRSMGTFTTNNNSLYEEGP